MPRYAQNAPDPFPLLDWSSTAFRLIQGPKSSSVVQDLTFRWMFGLAHDGSRVKPCPIIYHGIEPAEFALRLAAWAHRHGLSPTDCATYLAGWGIPGTVEELAEKFEAVRLAKARAEIADCLIVFDTACCWQGGDDITPLLQTLQGLKRRTTDPILATFWTKSSPSYFRGDVILPEEVSVARPAWLVRYD